MLYYLQTYCRKTIKKNETGIKKIDLDYMTNNIVVDFDPFLIKTGEIKKGWKDQTIKLLELLVSYYKFLLV